MLSSFSVTFLAPSASAELPQGKCNTCFCESSRFQVQVLGASWRCHLDGSICHPVVCSPRKPELQIHFVQRHDAGPLDSYLILEQHLTGRPLKLFTSTRCIVTKQCKTHRDKGSTHKRPSFTAVRCYQVIDTSLMAAICQAVLLVPTGNLTAMTCAHP